MTLGVDGLLFSKMFLELSKGFLGILKQMDSPVGAIPVWKQIRCCSVFPQVLPAVWLVFHNVNDNNIDMD